VCIGVNQWFILPTYSGRTRNRLRRVPFVGANPAIPLEALTQASLDHVPFLGLDPVARPLCDSPLHNPACPTAQILCNHIDPNVAPGYNVPGSIAESTAEGSNIMAETGTRCGTRDSVTPGEGLSLYSYPLTF
jgi:hypothetical protein